MRLLLVDPATGAADTLGFGSRPYKQIRWSPQGSRFAVVSAGAQGLRVVTLMTLDGSESDPLLTSDQEIRVDWSPGGDRLLLAEPWADRQLSSLDLASGTRTDIALPEPMRYVSNARWSQDGSRILFAGRPESANDFATHVYVLQGAAPLVDLGKGHYPAWRPRR